MNASELEGIWKRQEAVDLSPENIAEIAATVQAVDRKFKRKIWWRDLREIGAALAVAVVFCVVGLSWLRWIAVASCLFVAGYIVMSRRAVRSIVETSSLAERLQQMIRETETQIGLLRSVGWWYLLPCAVGMVAFVVDRLPRTVSAMHLIVFFAAMAIFYFAAYWLNQRVVRKALEPRRANLQHALAEVLQQS
jgi:drug/metabolite transporter (DMT)-like permease